MALNPGLKLPAFKGGGSMGACNAYPIDSIRITGVMDILHNIDIVLFSAENTLIKNGMVLPAGAVIVPQLRQAGKKLAIFSVDQSQTKESLTTKVNHLGLSFSKERILDLQDLENIEERFSLYPPNRILMVCSDVIQEVAFGRDKGLKTLLIANDDDKMSDDLGIHSHYVSRSV